MRAQVEAGKLNLHGAWFDIERGQLLEYDPARRSYSALDGDE